MTPNKTCKVLVNSLFWCPYIYNYKLLQIESELYSLSQNKNQIMNVKSEWISSHKRCYIIQITKPNCSLYKIMIFMR